jgi:branched-chain amino acid transport system ATP-binding protein
VQYGAGIGIRGASLELKAGETVMLVGPNGVGKTTLLTAIAGFISRYGGRVVAGRVLVGGHDLGGTAPYSRARSGIRLVPERKKVFALLSVMQNLELFHGKKLDSATIDAVWAYFPALKLRRDAKAGTLSGGERQMLALSSALLAPISLLLIDEMSLGLAPVTTWQMADVVKQIQADQSFTLLMVEQSRAMTSMADRVLELTDRGVVER